MIPHYKCAQRRLAAKRVTGAGIKLEMLSLRPNPTAVVLFQDRIQVAVIPSKKSRLPRAETGMRPLFRDT